MWPPARYDNFFEPLVAALGTPLYLVLAPISSSFLMPNSLNPTVRETEDEAGDRDKNVEEDWDEDGVAFIHIHLAKE